MQAVSRKFFKKGKLKDFGVGGGCDIKVIVVCILGNKFQEGAKLDLARRVNIPLNETMQLSNVASRQNSKT